MEIDLAEQSASGPESEIEITAPNFPLNSPRDRARDSLRIGNRKVKKAGNKCPEGWSVSALVAQKLNEAFNWT